jgi:hypothetical protein
MKILAQQLLLVSMVGNLAEMRPSEYKFPAVTECSDGKILTNGRLRQRHRIVSSRAV